MSRELVSRPYTIWQLLKAYWQSEQKISAYVFLLSALLMTIVLVGLEVALNKWYNFFYDSLQAYDKRGVYDLVFVFLAIAAFYIVVGVYRYYIQSFLGLRWRRWLTEQFLHRWLSGRSYYYLETFDKTTDNPDQRIQEDVNALVGASLSLLLGFVNAVATIFAFIYVLWVLSGPLTIPLGSMGSIHIPGYLAWIAVIYAILGTYFTFKIGKPLVSLNFQQQRKEADFRFAAVNVRSHAENIALYRGEQHEDSTLNRLLSRLLDNWYLIILRQKLLMWFTTGYSQISIIVPLLAALPNYFAKVYRLGGLIQTLTAFGQVQSSMSFFVNAYTQIAEWKAVNQRLLTFLNHMYEVDQGLIEKDKFIFSPEAKGKNIAVKQVAISTPAGEKLLENISQEFIQGKNYLIKGPSGIGKSTFVRALAGIWPYGSGEFNLPATENVMFLPQKLYMPLGTLKEALLFPSHEVVDDERVKELLRACGLPELEARLHETAMWSQQLSPGEQQRIGFVRVLLQKPTWVVLDESTSSLDLENEKMLYGLLKKELPNCSVISIGHRPSLEAFHDVQIDFKEYRVPDSEAMVS